MPYTVAPRHAQPPTGFEEYARLLNERGIDLARAPRVLEPASGRWLYVWDDQAGARRFAGELARRTSADAWRVEKVISPASPGPLGPLLVELVRRSDGLLFGLHPLSRMLLESVYPDAVGASSVFFEARRWHDFRQSGGQFDDLAWQMSLSLTGLSEDQLETIGVAVVDDDTDETLFERMKDEG